MAPLSQWTWVWVNSGSWWWTGRPGVLRFMGSQRVGHDWATELNWAARFGDGKLVRWSAISVASYQGYMWSTWHHSWCFLWLPSKDSVCYISQLYSYISTFPKYTFWKEVIIYMTQNWGIMLHFLGWESGEYLYKFFWNFPTYLCFLFFVYLFKCLFLSVKVKVTQLCPILCDPWTT